MRALAVALVLGLASGAVAKGRSALTRLETSQDPLVRESAAIVLGGGGG